jgi:hypothetical protein
MAQGFVRLLRRLALAGLLGAGAIALLLKRDGFGTLDAVLTAVLLAPAAIVLLFAHGVQALLALPERLRKLPDEGGQRLAELTRLAGEARTTRIHGVPRLLWRLRGTVGSLRDVAGIALPVRVLTPGYLGLSALAALACVALAGIGLLALLVLAVA